MSDHRHAMRRRESTRRRNIGAILAAAVLFLGILAVPAAASPPPSPNPDRPPDRSYTLSFLVSDPKWKPKDMGFLMQTMEKEGSLKRLGIGTSAERKPERALTPAENQRIAVQNKAQYSVESKQFATSSPRAAAPSYDYITLQECQNNADTALRRGGWIKNHFAYCQGHLHGHVAVECWGPFCRTVGRFSAVSWLIGYGKKGERRAEFEMTLQPLQADGIYLGSRLRISMDCTAANNGCQAGTNTGKDAPVALWRVNPSTKFDFTSPAAPPGPAQGEQVVTATFQPRFEIDASRNHDRDYRSTESGLRFDSAWYLTYSEGSIFNRTTPSMVYRLSDEAVKMSAHHINDALKYPASTKPQVADKFIPGGSDEHSIKRLYHNTVRRDQNRDEAGKVCRQEWPGYPELGQDCDEFPFASTYEGAARHRYDSTKYGQFSVRPINAPDNQTAGRRLGTWYGDDRIIDGDPFFVRILE